jgi:uncharacterized membrane protein
MTRRVGILMAGIAIGCAIGFGGVWAVWRVIRAFDVSIWFGVGFVALLIATLKVGRYARSRRRVEL